MKQMTQTDWLRLEQLAATRKEQILSAPNQMEVYGNIYYVSSCGDDSADGRSPEHPWKTLRRVSDAALLPGDGVLFRRGDLFRGRVITKSGVTYAAV